MRKRKNEWVKFERPKVIQDKYGRATHLSLGVIDVEKHLDLGNDKYSSKNTIMPLVLEKLVEIVNSESITPKTEVVKIRIKQHESRTKHCQIQETGDFQEKK